MDYKRILEEITGLNLSQTEAEAVLKTFRAMRGRRHPLDRKQIERRFRDVLSIDVSGLPIFEFDIMKDRMESGQLIQDDFFLTDAEFPYAFDSGGRIVMPFDSFVVADPADFVRLIDRQPNHPNRLAITGLYDQELSNSVGDAFCYGFEFEKDERIRFRVASQTLRDSNWIAGDEKAADANMRSFLVFLNVLNNPTIVQVERFKRRRSGQGKPPEESNKQIILIDRRKAQRRVIHLKAHEEFDPEQPSVSSLRRGHARREHLRTLRSERFKNKQGQQVAVRQSWVGPGEWTGKNGRYYRVLL